MASLEPVVIGFRMREGQSKTRYLYEIGATLDHVIGDTAHGCPVEMKEVDSYREFPLGVCS